MSIFFANVIVDVVVVVVVFSFFGDNFNLHVC
jgi:hypothetical protein